MSVIEEKLISCIDKGSLPQTILFYGPSLAAIDTLVFSVAMKLIRPHRFFENENFAELCALGKFPDFINVVKGDSGTIKIDDIRNVDTAIQYAMPYESENRIVYFKDASVILPQAQNALLKKIEEPPERTFFFFAVNKRNSLLPTVLSRSVPIFVPEANLEADFSELFSCFPFLADLAAEFGKENFSAEKNKFTVSYSDVDLVRITNISKLWSEIIQADQYETFFASLTSEKAEHLKRMLIKMRLALLAFCIKEKNPEIAKKITVFLHNQQYFSPDASVFYNLIGDQIG